MSNDGLHWLAIYIGAESTFKQKFARSECLRCHSQDLRVRGRPSKQSPSTLRYRDRGKNGRRSTIRRAPGWRESSPSNGARSTLSWAILICARTQPRMTTRSQFGSCRRCACFWQMNSRNAGRNVPAFVFVGTEAAGLLRLRASGSRRKVRVWKLALAKWCPRWYWWQAGAGAATRTALEAQ